MFNIISTLGFGFLLGIKHAFDADHLIAVSTMLSSQKSSKKAALIGTFWGIGHTTTLFIVGLMVLLLRVSIPDTVAQRLEIGVGIMLVILGIQAIFKKSQIHEHSHQHKDTEHIHLHTNHTHQHKKSFLIGSIHGLAGSGALMVLVISLIKSVWEGIFYILIFGIGSTLSMTIMSLFLGIPFAKSLQAFSRAERFMRLGMGLISVIFGIVIIIESLKIL